MSPTDVVYGGTEVIRRLEAERYEIAGSAWLRRRPQAWGAEDPRLAFEDGHQLVEAPGGLVYPL